MHSSLPAVRPLIALDVFVLSVVELPAAIALQQAFAQELLSVSSRKGVMLLCEHAACKSQGTAAHQPALPEFETHAQRLPVNRSGGVIEHGPTQLAILPVLNLVELELSPFGCRQALEQITAEVCRELGVQEVAVLPGLGIRCRTGMIARTALQIQNDVSQLGLYLNVSRCYSLQEQERSSSVESALQRPVDMADLKSRLLQHFETWLGQPTVHLFTRHPLLQRQQRTDKNAS